MTLPMYYEFRLKGASLLRQGIREAVKIGLTNIYTSQDIVSKTWQIGGTLNEPPPKKLKHMTLDMQTKEIDWQGQSALHSPFFKKGKIHVPLKEFSDVEGEFVLEPGAGFGDLSHPTTRLCLRQLSHYSESRYVLDIGCGNGVLTIAASCLGAIHAHGIDIDPAAIVHAHTNKDLNKKSNVTFSQNTDIALPENSQWLGLMNMTRLEQEIAWHGLEKKQPQIDTLITSGILLEQKEQYLSWAKQNEWEVISIQEEEGWLGFHIKCK